MLEKLQQLEGQLDEDSRGHRNFNAYKNDGLQFKTVTMIGDPYPSEN